MKILMAWVPNYRYGKSYEEVHYLSEFQKDHEAKIFPLIMPENMVVESLDVQLLEVIKAYNPDVFVSWLYKGAIRKETYEYIKHSAVRSVGIFGDDEKYFKGNSLTPSKDYTKLFNYSVTNYKPAIDWHRGVGQDNVIYMPFSANHRVFKKSKVEKDIQVSFCGAKNNHRINKLNKLVLDGIRAHIYGVGWDSRELFTKQYVNLINRTSVNINLSTDMINGREIVQVKGRDFEVPMAGGFLLTHAGAIEEFYEPGKEIETYSSDEELTDKIRFYIMKDEKREKIAAAGHKRALKNHKSCDRIRGLLNKIGGDDE